MFIDTHAHIAFPQFDTDRNEVLRRAADAGVDFIVDVGIDVATSARSVALANEYAQIYASVGIHPHEAEKATEKDMERIRQLAGHEKVVAIGEIGLDYHYPRPPAATQIRVFRQQIRMAKELGLPVIIHSRESNRDVLKILKEEEASVIGGIMHCYSGDLEEAIEFLSLGFLISIAGPVTFRNAQKLKNVVMGLSLDSLLLETDCPFLSPHPFRGQRNEPMRVLNVAREIASLKRVSLSEVGKRTTANAKRILKLLR